MGRVKKKMKDGPAGVRWFTIYRIYATYCRGATNPLLFSNRHESLLLLRILHARTVPANPQNPSGARTVRRPPGGLRRRRVTTAPPASLESNIAVLGARRRRRPLESVAPSPVLE
jgi:hypothetical protein